MRFRLLPSDEGFFTLFDAAAANIAECARRLSHVIADDNGDRSTDAVRECEHEGDELTRQILQRLNSTFVTPFDREDIHELAEKLDDVVDDMQAVAARMQLIVQRRPAIPELKQQADVMVQMAERIVNLMGRLESMKGIQDDLEAIDQLESQGDTIYREALVRLFSGEYDALDVVRWKDMVEAMEAAINTVEDISNVIESIVLKHA